MMTPKQKLPSPPPTTQSGFTLIECLLAIIIVSVLMVAVAPAIALSVATRVQARRVEVATEAARTYIDGLRSGTTKIPLYVSFVPKGEKLFSNNSVVQAGIPAPAAALTCPVPATNPKGYYCDAAEELEPRPTNLVARAAPMSLYCINLDGRGCSSGASVKNMVIQAFRGVTFDNANPGAVPPDLDGKKGYLLGVRVYRLDAFDGGGALKTTPATGKLRTSTFTMGGVGDRKAPLIELTTEIRTDGTSYESLRDRLGVDAVPTSSPSPSSSPTP